jgi:inner membrane protein
LFDWLNVYGIRLLEPFSSQWFYGDTLFIIDVWLWALLIASVWWSRRREKAGGAWRAPARVGIAVVLAYIGVNCAISAGATVVAAINEKSIDQTPSRYEQIIASPVPFAPWRRELIVGGRGGWFLGASDELSGYERPKPISPDQCKWVDLTEARRTNSQLDAFLFWSRAPFATRAADGSVILYDARFYDPRARGRFSVALPDVRCEELPAP